MNIAAPTEAVVELAERRIRARVTNIIGGKIWVDLAVPLEVHAGASVRVAFFGEGATIGFEAVVGQVKARRLMLEIASTSDPRVRSIFSRWSAGQAASLENLRSVNPSEAPTDDMHPRLDMSDLLEATEDIRPLRAQVSSRTPSGVFS